MTKRIDYAIGKVTSYLREIPDIDSGGCLVAAYAIYKFLIRNDLLPDSFVIVAASAASRPEQSHNTNTAFLEGTGSHAYPAYHFLYSLDNGVTLYDIEGISQRYHSENWLRCVIPIKDIERFYDSAMTCEDWNRSFKRHTWIPAINQKFSINVWDSGAYEFRENT